MSLPSELQGQIEDWHIEIEDELEVFFIYQDNDVFEGIIKDALAHAFGTVQPNYEFDPSDYRSLIIRLILKAALTECEKQSPLTLNDIKVITKS